MLRPCQVSLRLRLRAVAQLLRAHALQIVAAGALRRNNCAGERGHASEYREIAWFPNLQNLSNPCFTSISASEENGLGQPVAAREQTGRTHPPALEACGSQSGSLRARRRLERKGQAPEEAALGQLTAPLHGPGDVLHRIALASGVPL